MNGVSAASFFILHAATLAGSYGKPVPVGSHKSHALSNNPACMAFLNSSYVTATLLPETCRAVLANKNYRAYVYFISYVHAGLHAAPPRCSCAIHIASYWRR